MPGSGAPEPDRGFWVRIAVAAVAAVLVLGFVATKLLGGGGDTSTTDAASPSASTSTSTGTSVGGPSGSATEGSPPAPATVTSSPTVSAAASSTASPSPSPSTTKRPPTLSLTVLSRTYITIRVPGGRTLDSKIFGAGATATYDQKVLEVVNGRPAGVRFLVNGTPHKPGPATKPETFTARRG